MLNNLSSVHVAGTRINYNANLNNLSSAHVANIIIYMPRSPMHTHHIRSYCYSTSLTIGVLEMWICKLIY